MACPCGINRSHSEHARSLIARGAKLPADIVVEAERWDREKRKSRADLAWHEAAHAAAAELASAGFVAAGIFHTDERSGGVAWSRWSGDEPERNYVLVTLAGEAAELHHRGELMMLPDTRLLAHIRAASGPSEVSCDVCKLFRRMIKNRPASAFDGVLVQQFRRYEAIVNNLVSAPEFAARVKRIAAELARNLVSFITAEEIGALDEGKRLAACTRRIELPAQYRKAEVGPTSFRRDENSIEVIFTTGATVRRQSWSDGPYDEELVVIPEAVRLDRLNAGAPFLNTHNDWSLENVIGSVIPGSAKIAGGLGTARVKLSKAAGDADNVQKIKDGIVRNVSVGYKVHHVEIIAAKGDGVPTWRVVDWEPQELSAVPVPADAGAVVRSNDHVMPCMISAHVPDHVRNAEIRLRMRAKQLNKRAGCHP